MKAINYIMSSFLLVGNLLVAQTFKYKAPIHKIEKSGLHKLELTPHVQLYTLSSHTDLRLFDTANKEIPYVLLSEPVLKSSTDFVGYKIKSQTHYKNHTEIIIENTQQDKISNIAFNINNSDALKYCTIEGSDDFKQWFTISELQKLSLAYSQNYTNQFKCIYFPTSNYSYFRLLIDDWNAEPFKVNSAGYFKNSIISGKLNPIECQSSVTTDNTKKITTLKLTFPCQQIINQLSFKISAPRLYNRQASVYTINQEILKNKKTISHRNVIETFELNAEKPLMIDVSTIVTNELYIDIENKDNQPLQIDTAIAKQLAQYLIFDAEENNSYTLKTGDDKLQTPQYDLISFVKQSPQLLPEASISAFDLIKQNDTSNKIKVIPFYETSLFMWCCLGIAMIAIGFFALKLMQDMNPNNS